MLFLIKIEIYDIKKEKIFDTNLNNQSYFLNFIKSIQISLSVSMRSLQQCIQISSKTNKYTWCPIS